MTAAAWAIDEGFVPAARARAGEAVPVQGSAARAWITRITMAGATLFFVGLLVAGVRAGGAGQAMAPLVLAGIVAFVLYTAERGRARDRARGYVLRVDERGIHVADAPPVPWRAVRALELRKLRRSLVERSRPHLVVHVDAATVAALAPALRPRAFASDPGHVDHATSCVLVDVSALEHAPPRVASIVRAAWDHHGEPAAQEPAHA
jgi:hypothetical protein